MLDSNVLIDIAREPSGPVGAAFETKSRGEVSISVVAAGEIRFGMRKRPEARSNPSMAYLLESMPVEGLEPEVYRIYGDIRSDLEQLGRGMSANDYWIVAHAIARGAILVTGDRAIHEADVVSLRWEDWRSPSSVNRQE